MADVKRRFPQMFVWGSGDVFVAEDAADMLRETNVDGVWIARGAIGNPWIFREAAACSCEGKPMPEPATITSSGTPCSSISKKPC